ncbi:unnamed protein product [Caretta caretta]
MRQGDQKLPIISLLTLHYLRIFFSCPLSSIPSKYAGAAIPFPMRLQHRFSLCAHDCPLSCQQMCPGPPSCTGTGHVNPYKEQDKLIVENCQVIHTGSNEPPQPLCWLSPILISQDFLLQISPCPHFLPRHILPVHSPAPKPGLHLS